MVHRWWDEPLTRPCGLCNAQPGEKCRPWCVGWSANQERTGRARRVLVALLIAAAWWGVFVVLPLWLHAKGYVR